MQFLLRLQLLPRLTFNLSHPVLLHRVWRKHLESFSYSMERNVWASNRLMTNFCFNFQCATFCHYLPAVAPCAPGEWEVRLCPRVCNTLYTYCEKRPSGCACQPALHHPVCKGSRKCVCARPLLVHPVCQKCRRLLRHPACEESN